MVDPAAPRSVRGILAVLAIFALGVVLGATLTFAILHQLRPPQPGPPRGPGGGPGGGPVERLARDLDLDAQQRRQVRAIVERGHVRTRDVLEQTRREIREVLRPDQQAKLDRIRPPGPFGPPPGGRPGEGGRFGRPRGRFPADRPPPVEPAPEGPPLDESPPERPPPRP